MPRVCQGIQCAGCQPVQRDSGVIGRRVSVCSACLLVCLRLNVPPGVGIKELSESGSSLRKLSSLGVGETDEGGSQEKEEGLGCGGA